MSPCTLIVPISSSSVSLIIDEEYGIMKLLIMHFYLSSC
jgi:hypothetical protein